MKLFKEWALYTNVRKGCMLPLERFPALSRGPDAGYSSVYMFDEDAAKEILESKSSAGLSRFPVYADSLTIDLDDGDKQLTRTAEALALLGLGYDLWSSGGKGYHVVIPMTRMERGTNVPYSQKKWVESLNIGADLSLYQHGRILSLPGRKHPKTGKKKAFVRTVKGRALELPMLELPAINWNFSDVKEGGLDAALWQVLALIQSPPEPGNRHTRIWSTAKSLGESGLSFDTALDLLTEVNRQWPTPKEEDELRAAVSQAFQGK